MFPCITYTADNISVFNRFQNEIWDMAVEEAESLGCKNIADMIAGSRRAGEYRHVQEPDGMVRVRETRLGDGARSFPVGHPWNPREKSTKTARAHRLVLSILVLAVSQVLRYLVDRRSLASSSGLPSGPC